MLKDDICGWFLRPSSRVLHIIMADCIHGLDKILVQVKGVEKGFVLRGTTKFHLQMWEINL